MIGVLDSTFDGDLTAFFQTTFTSSIAFASSSARSFLRRASSAAHSSRMDFVGSELRSACQLTRTPVE